MTHSAETVPDGTDRVHAIIPVFNRVQKTLGCIECLKRQTHRNLRIIVADGGSTDGTPSIVPREHPDVILLTSARPKFWGGAMRMGMDRVLADGAKDGEFVLMVNNDTVIESENLRYLIETSRKYNAAVGAVVVDIDDPDDVIDGGVTLDWETYRFHTVKSIPRDLAVKLDCDVLPGRCTLVPIFAIRRAGTVDDTRFPHYIADYEFTHRLKREAGLVLAIDYRARVATRVETPSTADGVGTPNPVYETFSRRSKSNFVDHLRFVQRHAPASSRASLTRRLILAHFHFLLLPVKAVYRFGGMVRALAELAAAPIYSLSGRSYRCDNPIAAAVRPLLSSFQRRVGRLFRGPYLVNEEDCGRFGLRMSELERGRIVVRSGFAGYAAFEISGEDVGRQPENVRLLYRRASSPVFKMRRFIEIRLRSEPAESGRKAS